MVLKYVEMALGIAILISQGVIFIRYEKLRQELKKPGCGGGAPGPHLSIPCPPKPENTDGTEPMELQMKSADGYEIWLDGKRLHHIESYRIESSPYKNKAELSIKMLVGYPATMQQEG